MTEKQKLSPEEEEKFHCLLDDKLQKVVKELRSEFDVSVSYIVFFTVMKFIRIDLTKSKHHNYFKEAINFWKKALDRMIKEVEKQ